MSSLFLFLKDYQPLQSGFSGNLTSLPILVPGLQGMLPWFTGASEGKERGQQLQTACDSIFSSIIGLTEEGLSTEIVQSPGEMNVYGLSILERIINSHWDEVVKACPASGKAVRKALLIMLLPGGLESEHRVHTNKSSERIHTQVATMPIPGWGAMSPLLASFPFFSFFFLFAFSQYFSMRLLAFPEMFIGFSGCPEYMFRP